MKDFKGKVAKKLYKHWSNNGDLSSKFILAFGELIKTRPQAGWVRYKSFSTWEPLNKNEIYYNESALENKYSFLNGYYIGYTIQDCSSYENGEKDSIFPSIAKIIVQEDNKVQGFVEFSYRGVGVVPTARLLLSGYIRDENKLEIEWVNESDEKHTGKMCHNITDRGIEGSFTAFGADNGNSVSGYCEYRKIEHKK